MCTEKVENEFNLEVVLIEIETKFNICLLMLTRCLSAISGSTEEGVHLSCPQIQQLPSLVEQQRSAFLAEGKVPTDVRRDRLQRCIDLLVKYCDPLCDAISEDFGGRHRGFSMMYDVVGSITKLKHARQQLNKWVKPERRPCVQPFALFGAKAWVEYQPKGVVGVMGTWNAPLFTLFAPLAGILAAGNRAILKPSDMTPRTADVLVDAVAEFFDPMELTVVTGDLPVAQAFSALAFDHLVFTGSTAVGKEIMRNAADNLVPITLELGGKSPVIVGTSADIQQVATRICAGKANNSGQICVSPDHVYVPRASLDSLVNALTEAYQSHYPEIENNGDVTAVINARHLQRIQSYVEEARKKGARVESCATSSVATSDTQRRSPLQLVIDPPADSRIMCEEIFGPALVILTYERLDTVLADINGRPRPLALYYFGRDAAEERQVIERVISGGMTINDVMMHPALNDAPFGGIGASGIGNYNGKEGFIAFSHTRSFYRSGWFNPAKLFGLQPPYSDKFTEQMRKLVKP